MASRASTATLIQDLLTKVLIDELPPNDSILEYLISIVALIP